MQFLAIAQSALITTELIPLHPLNL